MKTPDQILDKCQQLLHGFLSETRAYNTDQIEFVMSYNNASILLENMRYQLNLPRTKKIIQNELETGKLKMFDVDVAHHKLIDDELIFLSFKIKH